MLLGSAACPVLASGRVQLRDRTRRAHVSPRARHGIRYTARRLAIRIRAESESEDGSGEGSVAEELARVKQSKGKTSASRKADSTDPIATFFTRRFGLAGGLAWLGFLTFGVVSEQFKTRRETYIAERDTKSADNAQEVTLPSGVKYTDKVFGGGEAVAPGLLVGVGYVMKVDGAVVLDTTKRPQVFLFGQRKGFAGGLCAGTEEVLRSMRNGGRRVITVPPEMAFGDRGTTLPQGGEVPPGATVEYDLTVMRVSIPPS